MKADRSPSLAKFATQCLTCTPLSRHKKLVCQPNLEMSSFSQSRNVRFMLSPPSLVFVAPAAGVGVTDDPASA